MQKKRLTILMRVSSVLMLLLIARLFYIQIIKGPNLSKSASIQRMSNEQLEKPRGNILDRNMIPFTNRDNKVSIVLKPLYLRGRNIEIEKVCNVLGLSSNKVIREINIKREPIFIETDEQKKNEILSLKIEGVSCVKALRRYDDNTVARHIIGYISKSDMIGETGIEKSYEDVLNIDSSKYVGVVTDARYNPVHGLGYRLFNRKSNEDKLNVKTTLDYHIQRIVEDVLDKKKIKGAVVVEDVNTGNIVAMASSPNFDSNNVGISLNSPQNELFNRAVASYNIGSIFKIIDVASKLEYSDYKDEIFYCKGEIKVGNKSFKCSSFEKGGHGWVGLNEAFALSCNSFFIDMGIRTGSLNLIKSAKLFGLGEFTGINEQGINESKGNLPKESDIVTYGDTANISIGQGLMMATPLQVADIVATVANGGIKNKINIVDSIVDNNGNTVKKIRKDEGVRIVSKNSSDKIKELMEEVTIYGTGKSANIEEFGGAGGKTGSAETGQNVNGIKVVHAWFAGYFPKDEPKYSISVFVEDGKNGGQVAAPIFAEIARQIMVKKF